MWWASTYTAFKFGRWKEKKEKHKSVTKASNEKRNRNAEVTNKVKLSSHTGILWWTTQKKPRDFHWIVRRVHIDVFVVPFNHGPARACTRIHHCQKPQVSNFFSPPNALRKTRVCVCGFFEHSFTVCSTTSNVNLLRCIYSVELDFFDESQGKWNFCNNDTHCSLRTLIIVDSPQEPISKTKSNKTTWK